MRPGPGDTRTAQRLIIYPTWRRSGLCEAMASGRKGLGPVRRIRSHCRKCQGGRNAVRHCADTKCDLWPYRLGRNPARAGIGGKPSVRHLRTKLELESAFSIKGKGVRDEKHADVADARDDAPQSRDGGSAE